MNDLLRGMLGIFPKMSEEDTSAKGFQAVVRGTMKWLAKISTLMVFG